MKGSPGSGAFFCPHKRIRRESWGRCYRCVLTDGAACLGWRKPTDRCARYWKQEALRARAEAMLTEWARGEGS